MQERLIESGTSTRPRVAQRGFITAVLSVVKCVSAHEAAGLRRCASFQFLAVSARKRDAGNHRTRTEISGLIEASAPSEGASDSGPAPHTIAEGLALLDDRWRGMLLRAAGRDADAIAREARQQAAATLPVWWQFMPPSITGSIDMRVDQWRREHPRATDLAGNQRRFLMFLPDLRDRPGTHRIPVVARIA